MQGREYTQTVEVSALADVALLVPKYKSKAEEYFAQYGWLVVGDELGQRIAWMQYEPMTFHLPGGKYTPDFLLITDTGRMVFVEVKGSNKEKGYRDARSKLRAAASLHPWATWYEWRGGRGDWALELIKPDGWHPSTGSGSGTHDR